MRHLMVTDSEVIESIGYELDGPGLGRPQLGREANLGTLEVVFKTTPKFVYRYPQVTSQEFVKIATADSIGKAVHEILRKANRSFTKSEREVPLKKS